MRLAERGHLLRLWLRRRIRDLACNPSTRATTLVGLVIAVIAFLLGWLATSPAWSMGVNWDTSGYAIELARHSPWSRTPWNSHYGVGHVYWLAVHAGQWLGWTPLDGLRVLNAVALTTSALVIYWCAIRLRVAPPLAALAAGVYLTSWGTLVLVFTWEDNLLFHPPALASLALCLVRLDAWRWRDALAAGLLTGFASLMSWQGAAFVLPAVGVAVFLGHPPRRWWTRLGHGALVPAGLAVARLLWVAGYWLTSQGLAFRDLLTVAFERPSPNFLPCGLAGWAALPGRWRELVAHVGLGLAHEVGPGVREATASLRASLVMGAVGLALSALLLVGVCLVLRRRIGRRVQFVVLAFVALLATAAVYLDLPADKYKRYDFLPMVTALGLVVLGGAASAHPSRPFRRAMAGALVAIVAGQIALACHWHRQWYARLPTARPPNRASHGDQTWFAFFRSLKRAAPGACAFVFTFDEVAHAGDNLEILAALVSELPDPIVIDAPPAAGLWPRPLPLAARTEVVARLRGCEWISASARPRLRGR